jgi:hypothetical protein
MFTPQPPKGGQKTLNILKETFLSLSYCYLCHLFKTHISMLSTSKLGSPQNPIQWAVGLIHTSMTLPDSVLPLSSFASLR